MFKLFKSAEDHFACATKGIQRYVQRFEAAIKAAEAEAVNLENKMASKVDEWDKKIEDAYSSYMSVETKGAKVLKEVAAEVEARKADLEKIKAAAQNAVDNHNKIYLP